MILVMSLTITLQITFDIMIASLEVVLCKELAESIVLNHWSFRPRLLRGCHCRLAVKFAMV